MSEIKIILKTKKSQALERFHPWVFSGAIKKIEGGEPNEGDIVSVYSNQFKFLGKGHFQNGSIAVRILSFEDVDIDFAFLKQKLLSAYQTRKTLGLVDNPNTNAYRLVFAEGDGLPGLIIDHYNGALVIQAHSYGMHFIRQKIADSLKEVYGDKLHTIYYKSRATLSNREDEHVEDGFLYGDTEKTVAMENGIKFNVDWVNGQKTGFFIDQRDNRSLIKQYAKGKSLLNTFCYTGGFSLYALEGGAELVHSVDSSKIAIELTDENVKLNAYEEGKHESFTKDTMDFLNASENKYDMIILDPPAYAKHQNVRHKAIQGYKRLNAKAIQMIKPGGILFTYSCSQVVTRQLFESTVLAAAIQSGRQAKILHHLSQPADHAASIYHPEGEYLKGLAVLIE